MLKTVPKYCTAIFVKDYFEGILPTVDPNSERQDKDALIHSAIKSSAAGLAGAALTNTLDVIRNEMFNKGVTQGQGKTACWRGLESPRGAL